MKTIITNTTQPTIFPIARVLAKACVILSTVALPLLLISCPDEAQPGEHIEIFPLYTCENGMADPGTSRTEEPLTELCTRCYFGYILNDAACVLQPSSSTSSLLATQVTSPVGSDTAPSLAADFESPQALLDAGWVATGDFANPRDINAWVGISIPNSDAGFVGQRSFNSCQPDAGTTCPEMGTLISPPVPVTHRYLNFLIAGTSGEAHIAVIILDSEDSFSDLDDSTNDIARIQPLYSTPGYISSDFDWRSIDLESEMAEDDSNIRIIIRDEGEGSINVDHFFFSDQPWGLRQDQWSNARPSFLGNPSTAIAGGTYIRLHAGGFDPATGEPTALFGGFDDASTLSTDDGWEYSDGILTQGATAPAEDGLAGIFGTDAARGRIGANPLSTCNIHGTGCRQSTGVTITSPAFTVTARYLNFLLGGGSVAGSMPSVALSGADPSGTTTEFRLFAGDNDAATASEAVLRMTPRGCAENLYSSSYGNEDLWQSIDVSAYMNQTLRFQLIDHSGGPCETITIDHMYFSDSPVSRSHVRGTLPSASPDTTPPGLVTNLRAVQNSFRGVQVVWTEPFDSDLANILLSWEPTDGLPSSPLTVAAGRRIAPPIVGLTGGTEYTFTAVSVDAAGNMSAASQPGMITIDDTAPPTPTALAANAISGGGVLLTWTNPTDADFSHAVLRWSPTDGDQISPLAVRRGGDNAVITGLENGTQYSFTVAAVDIVDNASFASAAQTATADSFVNPVTGPMATAGDTSISLSWTAPSDTDFASVSVTWDPVTGTQPLSVATGTSTASITGLTNGTQYTVSIIAVDTAGNISHPVTATATPAAP